MPKDEKPAAPEMSTADAIHQLAEAIQSRNPSDLEKSGMSPERQAAVQGRTLPRRERDVRGVGENGATFLIHVVSDPAFPNGRCLWFTNYKYPSGMTKSVSNGGRVPDGMRIAFDRNSEMIVAGLPDGEELPQSACTREYILWRLETFHQLDSKAIIGKELKPHFCDPAGDGMRTPWSADQVAA